MLPPPHQSTVNSMVVVLGVVPQGPPALAIAPDPLLRLSDVVDYVKSEGSGCAKLERPQCRACIIAFERGELSRILWQIQTHWSLRLRSSISIRRPKNVDTGQH